MLINILAKIFAGAVVGYATNYLAIKMLFQEYFKIKFKPWKINFSLGGVIVKERQSFEARISELVESDVIHHHAIDQELRKPEFSEVLSNLTENLFQHKISAAISEDFKISQIPEIQTSFLRLKDTLTTSLREPLARLWTQLADSELTKNQIVNELVPDLTANLFRQSLAILKEEKLIQAIIADLLVALSQKKVNDFIEPKVFEILSQNLVANLPELHRTLEFSYYIPVDDLIQKTLKTLDSELIISQLTEKLGQRTLSEFFTDENVENLPKAISRQIQNLFQSEVSEDIIQTLLKFLFGVLREEKATIYELLSNDLKNSLDNFLVNQLPDLLATLIPWIRQKKAKLELLIQDAFQENTSVIGQLLVALFLGNVGRYVGIEEKLIDLIEKQDTNQLAQKASQYLQDYLKTNTIGELIQGFNQERILATLSPVLRENIANSIQNFQLVNLSNLLDKPIQTWFSKDRMNETLQELLGNVIEKQLKEKWLYDQQFTDFVHQQILNGLHRLSNLEIKELIPAEKINEFSQRLHNELVSLIDKNAENLIQQAITALQKYLNEKPFQEWLGSQENGAENALAARLEEFLTQEFGKIQNKPLVEYVDKLNQIPNLEGQTSQALRNYILTNLEDLMKGRIENLVKENLAKQGDIQLRAMVYKAMGEELEPLSLFGGLLGAITGAMLLIMPEYQSIGIMLLVSGLAYGITGWGTNWLAIKMLFKPYNAIKIPFTKFNLPFTPGVVAKNKARFANSMGRFLGDKLLNQDNLQESFQRNRPQMEAKLESLLAENNYAFVEKILQDNQAKIAQNFSQWIYNFLTEDKGLKKNLADWLDNPQASLKNINTQSIENQLIKFLESPTTQNQVQQKVFDFLNPYLEKNQTFRDILPENFLNNLPALIQEILTRELHKLSQSLTIEKVLNLINFKALEERFDSWLDSNLEQILNAEQEERLKDQIFVFLRDKLQSEEIKGKIFEFLDKKLNQELAPDRQIKDILGGRLLELLEQNLSQILKRVLNLGMEWLQKNREEIAEKIYADAYEQTPLAWTYKNSILGTTYDLIDEGIPNFFEQEFASLQNALSKKIDQLGETALSSVKIGALDSESLKNRVNQILDNQQLIRKTRQLTNIILEERIFKIPLKSLLQEEAQDLLNHLRGLLNPEIELIINHLREQLSQSEKASTLSYKFAELLHSLLYRTLFTVPLQTIFMGIQSEDIERSIQKTSEFLWQSESMQMLKNQLISTIFNRLKTLPLPEIIEPNQIKNELIKILTLLLEDEKNKDLIINDLEKVIQLNLNSLNQNIAPETKAYVVKTAGSAIFATLENNLLALINSIDFKGIVVREISAMHPKELEGLFYGFARKYFTYLIGYGFIFGIIFGWAIDFGILGIWSLFR
jgi:uncharacterized membrane protein YheB (UPF0754 family)